MERKKKKISLETIFPPADWDIYKQWKERRKKWFWKVFSLGVSGIFATFIMILSIIEKIDIPKFKIGVIIVLGVYSFIAMVSVVVWFYYSFKMKKIERS